MPILVAQNNPLPSRLVHPMVVSGMFRALMPPTHIPPEHTIRRGAIPRRVTVFAIV